MEIFIVIAFSIAVLLLGGGIKILYFRRRENFYKRLVENNGYKYVSKNKISDLIDSLSKVTNISWNISNCVFKDGAYIADFEFTQPGGAFPVEERQTMIFLDHEDFSINESIIVTSRGTEKTFINKNILEGKYFTDSMPNYVAYGSAGDRYKRSLIELATSYDVNFSISGGYLICYKPKKMIRGDTNKTIYDVKKIRDCIVNIKSYEK